MTGSALKRVAEQRDHSIDPARIGPAALTVTRELRAAGYQALLVGGCVRDLLLGLSPKDYDVATDATPDEVRRVFRRARVIGRRFRIVHVRVGREVIEVTTFRRSPHEHATRNGRVLRDNAYGDLDSDAWRRDFTVNALYYDPLENRGIDHVDGLDDLENRVLRIIGEPRERFVEDPVRVLRAVRFMAKLDFGLEARTEAAMIEAIPLLREAPAARLFDEVLKLFHHGFGEKAGGLLHRYGILKTLFPMLAPALSERGGARLGRELPDVPRRALRNTDARVAAGKPVIAPFLFAALLWPAVDGRMKSLADSGESSLDVLHRAIDAVVEGSSEVVAIPRRVSAVTREIWDLEHRLRERRPRRVADLLANRRFRAAFDFLLLRVESGDGDARLARWWEEIQELDYAGRRAMIDALGADPRRRRSRRPRKRKLA